MLSVNVMKKYMNDYSVKRIDEMHRLLNKDKSAKGYDISPIDWYDLATQKIDLMHKVEMDLVNTLTKDGPCKDTEVFEGEKKKPL